MTSHFSRTFGGYVSDLPLIFCSRRSFINIIQIANYIWFREHSFLRIKCVNFYGVGNGFYTYANILDTEQPLTNSVAGMRSNLFATKSIITRQKQVYVPCLNSRRQLGLFLENKPAFKESNMFASFEIRDNLVTKSRISNLANIFKWNTRTQFTC